MKSKEASRASNTKRYKDRDPIRRFAIWMIMRYTETRKESQRKKIRKENTR